MFDKLKQLKELRELQSQAQTEKFEGEKNGTKVVMNGALSVEDVYLNPDLSLKEQEGAVQEALNEAIKKVQMAMMQKFQGMM